MHQMGKHSQLSAAIAISVAWDPFKTRESLEQRLDNRVIYSRFMASNLCSLVKRYIHTCVVDKLKYNLYSLCC